MDGELKHFLFKTSLFVVGIFVLFEVFFQMGIYPIITNSQVFDQKVVALQKRHLKSIKLIAIGSSAPLYGLDDSIIVSHMGPSFYNLSSWSMQITDSRDLMLNWQKMYHPKYVLLCSVLSDFRQPTDTSYENYIQTSDVIKNSFPEFYYFKDYHSVSQLLRRRYIDVLAVLDRWGGNPGPLPYGPKEWKNWNEKEDKFPTEYTNGNYKALDSLASFLHHRQVTLIFVQMPMSNSRTNEATFRATLEKHFDRCHKILEQNHGIYINHYDPAVFSDSVFYDKVHLYKKGATLFTNLVVQDLKTIIK